VQFGAEGDSPSDPPAGGQSRHLARLHRHGLHRSGRHRLLALAGQEDETKKRFYGVKQDIEYLSRIVYDWLLKNGAWPRPNMSSARAMAAIRAPAHRLHLQTDWASA
jgi:hypothetical protein